MSSEFNLVLLGDKLEGEEESKKSQRREIEEKACDGRRKEEREEKFVSHITSPAISKSSPSPFALKVKERNKIMSRKFNSRTKSKLSSHQRHCSAFSTDCSYHLPTFSSRGVYLSVFFRSRIKWKFPLSVLNDISVRRQLWSLRRMGAAIPADNLFCFFVIFAFLSQLSLQSSLVSTFVHTSVALHCHS